MQMQMQTNNKRTAGFAKIKPEAGDWTKPVSKPSAFFLPVLGVLIVPVVVASGN